MMSYRLGFFEWVAACCKELDWPITKGEEMMPKVDACWYMAYDDGLTPQEATEEYKRQTKTDFDRLLMREEN